MRLALRPRREEQCETAPTEMVARNPSLIQSRVENPLPSRQFEIHRFDPIVKAAQFVDHSVSAVLSRSLANCGTPFLVTHSAVQNDPD